MVLMGTQWGCAAHAPRPPPKPALTQDLPARFGAVRLDASAVATSLATAWLHTPLRVHAASPPPSRWPRMLRVSHSTERGTELPRAYAAFCDRRGSAGDCLRLLEDGPHLDGRDRRDLALALAVHSALDALDAEARALVNASQLWTTLSLTLTGYLVLLTAPEPITKGVATALTVLLWAYLGWELLDLLHAWLQLSADAETATTFAQVRAAGERFGAVIGPNSVRILLLLGTASLSGGGALLSRAPTLPGFSRAASAAGAQGVRLLETARDAERIQVAVTEGTLQVVLPANALSMAARSGPQVHHIATVENNVSTARGGPWTPRFKKIFDKAGMSMEDPANKAILEAHRGPHPEKYHARVHERLMETTDGCPGTTPCREALTSELRKMMRELADPTSDLHKLLSL
nr:AHH domain-containing protein [Archangium primigenium]